MKIYPIIDFKGAHTKSKAQEKEISSQENSFERASLEILGNYNKGAILSFRGENVEEIKRECRELLDKHNRQYILSISNKPAIAKIQRELLELFLKSDCFKTTDFSNAIANIQDDENIANIQKEMASKMLSCEKFSGFDIPILMGSIRVDAEIAALQHDLISELAENKRFNGHDIVRLVSRISVQPQTAKVQGEIIRALSQNERFRPLDIENIVPLIAGSSEVSKIKYNLTLDLAQNDKFQGDNVSEIVSGLSHNIDVANIQVRLAQQLSENSNYSASSVEDIITSIICDTKRIASFKENFINEAQKSGLYTAQDIESIIVNLSSLDPVFKFQNDFIDELKKIGLLENKNVINSLGFILRDLNFGTYKDSIKTIQKINDFKDMGFFDNEIFKKTPHSLYHLLKYTEKRPECDIKKILNYMEKIDFEKLSERSPVIKSFNFNQYLIFCNYHLKNGGKTEFSDEDLTFKDGDLNELISENYMSARSLSDLFAAYPMTKRQIGKIPSDWLSSVPSDKKNEASQEIYNAISVFQKNHNENLLSENFSKILRKKTNIEELGHGVYGTCYKISIENASDCCLKIFDRREVSSIDRASEIHGQHIEVQMGLFVNRHSNEFARMYFGRLSPGDCKDGFLVTQFLDDKTEPDESQFTGKNSYIIYSKDRISNVINEKVIDYGAIRVKDYYSGEDAAPYDVFKKKGFLKTKLPKDKYNL